MAPFNYFTKLSLSKNSLRIIGMFSAPTGIKKLLVY